MNKLQNIIFFLGAGFSAPFGLPVMGNFIDKSKDLYFSNEEKYKTIKETLKLIDRFSKVKNFMNVNLYNIEDLLSITYMEAVIKKNSKPLENITTFIKTVIEAYTKEQENDLMPFIRLFSNLEFENTRRSYFIGDSNYAEYYPKGKKYKNTTYGIITLNYDLLLEKGLKNYLELSSAYYTHTGQSNPITEYLNPTKILNIKGIPIAKLHGSVDTNIIPPTWNKTINNEIHDDWYLSTQLLKEATHIIFLGYSLPLTDTYIKFLFSSSLNSNQRLKKISAISLDSDELTELRFKSLFTKNFKYHNKNLKYFFQFIQEILNEEYDFDFFDSDFLQYT